MLVGFEWPINSNAKNIEDEAEYGTFFIRGTDFSAIWRIIKTIGYILVVEFTREQLLMEFMGGSAIKDSRIHDGVVWSSR